MNENINIKTSQMLSLENRKKLSMSGVCEVESSSEKQVLLKTNLGRLKISGEGLNIEALNIEEGSLCVCGYVNVIEYKENKKNNGGLLASLLR